MNIETIIKVLSKEKARLSNHPQGRVATQLTLFSGVCLLSVFLLFTLTKDRVKQNERDYLRASLTRVLPEGITLRDFDNEILDSAQSFGKNTLYPACRSGHLRYALIELETDQGYSGTIRLLVNIDVREARLVAVRPLFHQETPGLGDQIDMDKSDWLKQFELPLGTKKLLSVTKDGGNIDTIAGATITSRAVTTVLAQEIFSKDFSALDVCY